MLKLWLTLFMAIGMTLSALAIDFDRQIVKKFRYPDYDAKGQLKFEVMGDEAQGLPDGLIRIVNLKLTFYEEGKVMMEVTAPQCLFDRVKRTAVSTSDVCVARAEMVLTGRGYVFQWDANQGHLDIHDRVKVVLKKVRE